MVFGFEVIFEPFILGLAMYELQADKNWQQPYKPGYLTQKGM